MITLRPPARIAQRIGTVATVVTYPSLTTATAAAAPTRAAQGSSGMTRLSTVCSRKKAIGPEQQHRDEEQEAEAVAVAARDVGPAERLNDPQKEAADQGAGNRAHSGEDDHDEGLERNQGAHRRLNRKGEPV